MVNIVSLSVCYITVLSSVSIVLSFGCYVTMSSLHGSIICLLHHCSVLGFGCLHCLSFTFCLLRHYNISSVSSTVCFVTILSLPYFHCFIICLLRHCSVLGFDCYIFCLLCHYAISSRFPLFRYMFVTSLLCTRLRLLHLLFVTSLYYFGMDCIVSSSMCYVTILSLQGFLCCTVCFYVTSPFSSSVVRSSLCYMYVTILSLQGFHRFCYLLVTSLLCSLLQLSP